MTERAPQPIPVAHLSLAPADAIERLRGWLRRAQDVAPSLDPAPCCVVTPLGLPHAGSILRLCDSAGLGPVERRTICDWPRRSIAVYARSLDDERLQVALAFEALWQMSAVSGDAELWLFPACRDQRRVVAVKAAVRQAVGSRRIRVELPDIALRSPHQVAQLHSIHVPDLDRLAWEHAVLLGLADGAPQACERSGRPSR
jgi:hypothetical protein